MLGLFYFGACSIFCLRYTINTDFKYPATGSFFLPNSRIFKNNLK